MQLVHRFLLAVGNEGPIFVLLGRLLEVFVDGVKLIEGYFILEFVQIKHPNLNYSFCAFVCPVGRIVVSLFIDGIEFGHFE